MRISKKTREQAALLCQLAASNGKSGLITAAETLGLIDHEIVPSYVLASKAFDAAYGSVGGSHCTDTGNPDRHQDWFGQMAEAESMLRTGWSPPIDEAIDEAIDAALDAESK